MRIAVMGEIVAVWRDPANVEYLGALIAAQHENADLGRAYRQQLEGRRTATSVTSPERLSGGTCHQTPTATGCSTYSRGVVLQRVLLRRMPLADDFPETIVDQLLAGFSPLRRRRQR